ncbi:hypothetical protein ACFY2R_07280 [Micromonospora olivasterospora]|uniref:hypothetical protein n=1 Tax=Micromonospora olivasterospora TaxID=1880 RepID=UPI001FE26F31|nr:hypothetical protein [Micromonospora olivasterospora]
MGAKRLDVGELDLGEVRGLLGAGWWAAAGTGTNGQAAAANQASIVRSTSPGGNGVVLFGTDPTFRLHPKGLQPQLGRALLWAARP